MKASLLRFAMMLGITDKRQFQTLSLLACTIFELAMEVKLIANDLDSGEKIELFSLVERLKAARRTVAFCNDHSDADMCEHHNYFIRTHGARIDKAALTMWPPNPKTPNRRPEVKHWTLRNVEQRARFLGAPFDKIYNLNYAPLSWMTHSGVVVPRDMTAEWIVNYVGVVYSIAAESYTQLWETVADHFQLSATNEHIKKKILCNRDLAFTNTREEGEAVMRGHGLWGYFEPPSPFQ